jgi:aminoglycoside phosphotransferase (APT) family kinase protein
MREPKGHMREPKGHIIIGRGMRSEIMVWDTDSAPGELVLKLYLPGYPQTMVANEAESTRRVAELGAPAPRVHGTVEIDGRHGIIMERIDGPSMERAVLGSLLRLRHYGRLLASVHHAINNIVAPPYAGRQTDMLARKISSPRSPLAPAEKDALLDKLNSMPDAQAVCHGDLHLQNVIMSPARGPVVIDWDSPCAGNPICDVARTYLVLTAGKHHARDAAMRAVTALAGGYLARTYVAAYGRLVARPGLVSEQEFADWFWLNAAARLCEGIAPEQDRLMRIARRGLAAGRGRVEG